MTEDSFSGSSWIKGAKYNTETNVMQIYIGDKGEVYECVGVGNETWNGFKNASSKGKYFNQYIKGQYNSSAI